MRAAISLLVLLLYMCGGLTRSTQTEIQTESQDTGAAAAAEVSTQLDVSAELKELRDMVIDLRATLRHTQYDLVILDAKHDKVTERLVASETKVQILEVELDNLKKENAVQEVELAVLKTRLAATETEVEDLKMKASAALEQELTAVKTRLAASETTADDLKKENAAQEAELTAVKSRLAASETKVQNLEKEIKAAPKVAFSAGLTDGTIQAGNVGINLVFSRVITNVGEAYSSTTGFFTAPVKGVYYFRFTVMDRLDSDQMVIILFKNGEEMIMGMQEYDTDGHGTYLSSGLTLQLEKGDTANLMLPQHEKLVDNIANHCTFSGFLIFPL